MIYNGLYSINCKCFLEKTFQNFRNHIFLPTTSKVVYFVVHQFRLFFFNNDADCITYNYFRITTGTNYFRHFADLSKKLVIVFLSHLYLLNNWLFVKFTWFNYLSSNFPANDSISSFVSFIYCRVNPFIDRFKGNGCLQYKDSVH